MNEKEKLYSFLYKNFEPFMDYVSRFYPLSHKFIEENQEYINWKALSKNKKVKWTFEFIEKYEKKWMWIMLNNNPKAWNGSIEFVEKMLERFPDKLRWRYLSRNKGIKFNSDFIKKYYNKFEWSTLKKNINTFSNIEILEEYEDKISWNYFSFSKKFPWSVELIEEFGDLLNWRGLSENHNLPWSIDFIERYQDKLNWKILSGNRNLDWSDELLEKFEDKWDWDTLITNDTFSWDENLINQFRHKINFESSINSNNPSFNQIYKVDEQLINEHLKKIDWEKFSESINIEWSEELLDRFDEKLNWDKLSANPGLPWTEEFFRKYKGKWQWQEISKNKGIPWTEKFIEKYKNYLDLNLLITNIANNKDVKRTKLIRKYIKEIDFNYVISNSNFFLSSNFIDRYRKILNLNEISNTPNRLPISIDFLDEYGSQISLPVNIILKKAFNIKITEDLIREVIKNKITNDHNRRYIKLTKKSEKILLPENVYQKLLALGNRGQLWQEDLTGLIEELEKDWNIKVGNKIFDGGSESLVIECADEKNNKEFILKLVIPKMLGNTEFEHEINALKLVNGNGYVKLFNFDITRRSMLLEKLGTTLENLNLPVNQQIEIICNTLKKTWLTPPEQTELKIEKDIFSILSELIVDLSQKGIDEHNKKIANIGLDLCKNRSLNFNFNNAVLVHGDAHSRNLLQATSQEQDKYNFKLIDPDGIICEPAYDLGVVMRGWINEILSDPVELGLKRCKFISDLTNIDSKSIWEWGIIQCVTTGLLLIKIGQKEEGLKLLKVAGLWNTATMD